MRPTPARRGRCCRTRSSWPPSATRWPTRSRASAASRTRLCGDIVPAVEQWHYRNKLEYSFGEGDDGELILGFHHPGRWDLIDPVENDILASERVDAVRAQVLDWCREAGLSAYDRRDHGGFLRNLVVREGRRTGQVQARLVTSQGAFEKDLFAAAIDADSVLWTQAVGRGRDHPRRQDAQAQGQRPGGRGDHRPRHHAAVRHLGRRVLPDQHRDGRGACTRSRWRPPP